MSALWRGHEASPRQRLLVFRRAKRPAKLTQTDVLLAMLREARANGRAVQLPEIMAMGIARYCARFNELRSRGFVIHNETERSKDGRVLSRYWLRHDPERDLSTTEALGEQDGI